MPSLDTEAQCVVDKEWPEFDGYHCMTAHDMACGRRAPSAGSLPASRMGASRSPSGSCMAGCRRSREGCGRWVIRSVLATRRSARSPIRRTAGRRAPAAFAGTPRAIAGAICRTPARQALRPGHQHPAPPGRGRRAKAVRPWGTRSHPSPPVVRRGERNVAGRAGRPLSRSHRNSSVNRDGSRDGSSVCCRPPALS